VILGDNLLAKIFLCMFIHSEIFYAAKLPAMNAQIMNCGFVMARYSII